MRNFLLVLFLAASIASLKAQDSIPQRLTTSSTMIGIGNSSVKDTYLTPITYNGWELNVLNERMRYLKKWNNKVSTQQLININFSSNLNSPENGKLVTGYLDYSYGFHYHFKICPNFKILTGALVNASAGFIYNLRNSNNPASAKLDANLSASAMAIYTFKIKKLPVTLRYQVNMPFIGAFFSPNYEQSYYEIFALGNSKGVIHTGSFGNHFNMLNYFTVDVPVSVINVRVGYMNRIRTSNVHSINTEVFGNSFLFGITKEFIPYQRNNKSTKTIKAISAFY